MSPMLITLRSVVINSGNVHQYKEAEKLSLFNVQLLFKQRDTLTTFQITSKSFVVRLYEFMN